MSPSRLTGLLPAAATLVLAAAPAGAQEAPAVVGAAPEPTPSPVLLTGTHPEPEGDEPAARPRPKRQRPAPAARPRPDRPAPVKPPRGEDTAAAAEEAEPTSEAAPLATPVPLTVGLRSQEIPAFLLPIYLAAGAQHGVPWEVLAAINLVETAYGENTNVSSAGAEGWMQFMPATWAAYGVDADGDGTKDPQDPHDAIFAAARYLQASGAATELRAAIFAYNHADWYVDLVLRHAARLRRLDAAVQATAGLAAAREPFHGGLRASTGNARDGLVLTGRRSGVVRAVAAGTVLEVRETPGLGRYVRVRDDLGATQTYARLGSISMTVDAAGLSSRALTRADAERHRAGLLLSAAEIDPARWLRRGARVEAGAILGRGSGERGRSFRLKLKVPDGPHVHPRRFVRAWTALARHGSSADRLRPRAADPRALTTADAATLAAQVLADERIEIYACGRADVQLGRIDRRVLALLVHLADRGLHPTVTSLTCGHSYRTASGNVSHHSHGAAVDIAAFNGQPVLGHQGSGSLTDQAIRAILELPAELAPAQVISLMRYDGRPTTLAMADHDDHLHVGFAAP